VKNDTQKIDVWYENNAYCTNIVVGKDIKNIVEEKVRH